MAVMSTVAVIKPLRLLLMEYGRPAQLVVGLSSSMASMEIWCAHPTMSCVTVLFHTFQEHVLMLAISMESVSMGSATVSWALVVNIAINVFVPVGAVVMALAQLMECVIVSWVILELIAPQRDVTSNAVYMEECVIMGSVNFDAQIMLGIPVRIVVH